MIARPDDHIFARQSPRRTIGILVSIWAYSVPEVWPDASKSPDWHGIHGRHARTHTLGPHHLVIGYEVAVHG